VLCVASTGIAALLLPNGRTSHTQFKIPINLTDDGSSQLEVKLFRLRVQYMKGGAVTWMCHLLLPGEQDPDVPASRTQDTRYIAYPPQNYEEIDNTYSLKTLVEISVELR
jgi:hypothetical protein